MPAAGAALDLSDQAVLPAAALEESYESRWKDALAAIDGAMPPSTHSNLLRPRDDTSDSHGVSSDSPGPSRLDHTKVSRV